MILNNICLFKLNHCWTSDNKFWLQVFSGYKVHRTKLYVAYFCSVITLGFLPLLFFWKPTWKLKLTHTSTSLKFASSILIQVCARFEIVYSYEYFVFVSLQKNLCILVA